MRTLVVLAVMGLCSALPRQAYNTVHRNSYGTPSVGHYQPRYVGPLASSVPAGVDGRIEQVPDTYEVAAARDEFFRAYQRQLADVGALGRYAAGPTYQRVSVPSAPSHASVSYSAPSHVTVSSHPAPSHTSVSYSAPSHVTVSSHSAPSHGPVSTYSAPSHGPVSVHSGPSYSSNSHVVPSVVVVSNGHVQDTPEVAAAKAEFFQLYNQQAAAAAAAPDDDVYYGHDNGHYH